jgi:hypothetical protein
VLSNTFEGGTDGAAVTTANSGAASGSAFDSVTTGGSGSLTFRSGAAAHGNLGLQAQTSGNVNSSAQWSSAFGSPSQFWVRDYFVIGLLPSVIARLSQFADSSAVPQWGVAVDTSGHIGVRNISAGSFPSGGLSGATLTPGQFGRYELSAAYSAGAWTVVLRVFLGTNSEGTTPDFTLTPSAMTLNPLASAAWGAILPSAAFWNADHDDIAVSLDGWIGPYQQFVLPFSRARTPNRLGLLLRTRRGASFPPPWAQSFRGTPLPLALHPAGARPRLAPRIARSRQFAPPRAQSGQGVPFPLVTRHRPPAYWSFAPAVRPQRARIFQPRWPQSGQGVPFPLFTRGRPEIYRKHAPLLWRGRFFMKRLPQDPQGSPFNLVTRQPGQRPRWIASRRLLAGRTALPPWPQGRQGTPFPLRLRRADNVLIRFARIWRSPRMRQWYQAKLTAQASAALSAAGTLSAASAATRFASAALESAGSLHASPVITRPAATALSAAGTMSAVVSLERAAGASLTGTGTLAAAGSVSKTASASLSASGSLTAAASGTPAARLSGSGALTVSARGQQLASAALSAAGSLLVGAGVTPPVREILIEGNRLAPWDEVIATGAWQRREPPDEPAVVTVQKTITGVYDEE